MKKRYRMNDELPSIDYSARCTFITDPTMKLQRCGLPKSIVLRLFRPLIVRRMLDAGLADEKEDAEAMLGRPIESTGTLKPSTWIASSACDNLLEEVIAGHPVLLSRAPSLNRSGIQAFQPMITAGNVIRIHPLMFQGFDSEQDGDQVTVYLPLWQEAQREAVTRMMPVNNLTSPVNGTPVFSPSRDVALSCYYVTYLKPDLPRPTQVGDGMVFASTEEVRMAYELGKVAMGAKIWIRLPKNKRIRPEYEQNSSREKITATTVGRVLFNAILPAEMVFYNQTLNQQDLEVIVADCHRELGQSLSLDLLEQISHFALRELTRSGVSIGMSDLNIAHDKAILIAEAEKSAAKCNKIYERGIIGPSERQRCVTDAWQTAFDAIKASACASLENDDRATINPLLLMGKSRAGVRVAQVNHLVGMLGSVPKTSGELYEIPIKSNFVEGLSIAEFFMNSVGSRRTLSKGWQKKRRSRLLTRKLVEACRHVAITEYDCGTTEGIKAGAEDNGPFNQIGLAKAIVGRVSLRCILHPLTDETVVQKNEPVTADTVRRIEAIGLEQIVIRSPLTCQSEQGVCQLCYGMDISTASLVDLGVRVGVIAAQSIGEASSNVPDLYHRTLCLTTSSVDREIESDVSGVVRFANTRIVKSEFGERVVVSRNATVSVYDGNNRWLKTYDIPEGANLHVSEGEQIGRWRLLCDWNPHAIPILSNATGYVRFEDVVEGITARTERDPNGVSRVTILKTASNLDPRILVKNAFGNVLDCHYLHADTSTTLVSNQLVFEGEILASYPRRNEHHFVGGLLRAVELLKGKRPTGASILARCDGEVEISGDRTEGKRIIVIHTKNGYEVPHDASRHLMIRVMSKDRVIAGDPLTDGPLDPLEVLSIMGERAAQKTLVDALRAQFSVQSQPIETRHFEVVVSQMMRWIRIADPGDSNLARGDMVDRVEFHKINQSLRSSAHTAATGQVRILGISEVAKQREAMHRDYLIAKNCAPTVQRSVAVDDSASTTMHCFLKFTDEAFRERRKQTIEMVAERTLLYTSESTAMVGRFDPVQQQVVVTPEAWGAFWEQVDLLEVWSWTNYHRTVRDGGKWTLELQRGDRQVIASGRNARPDNYPKFYRCLKVLVGGRLS